MLALAAPDGVAIRASPRLDAAIVDILTSSPVRWCQPDLAVSGRPSSSRHMRFHDRALETVHRLLPPEQLRTELARVVAGDGAYARDSGRDCLDKFTRETGLAVPPSLLSWYSNPQALRLMRLLSNDDYPLYPEEFVRLEDEPGCVVQVMSENQGACIWGVPFDGSEDPPVLVRYADHGRPWRNYSRSFSDFVYSAVLDWGFPIAAADVYQGECGAGSVGAHQLGSLLDDHERGPASVEASGDSTVRYVSANTYVKLTGHSYWLVAGLSFEAFDQVMARLGLN